MLFEEKKNWFDENVREYLDWGIREGIYSNLDIWVNVKIYESIKSNSAVDHLLSAAISKYYKQTSEVYILEKL